MAVDLSSYDTIETALCVRIIVDYYNGQPVTNILRFSDYNEILQIGESDTFIGLGKFVSIGATPSELKSSNGSMTLTISGIPNTSISEVINSQFKGARIEVYRVFLDASTGQVITELNGGFIGRFFGIINNYSLDESYDVTTRTSSNTITFTCSSKAEILENKVAGRKTNPSSWRRFYSNDASMDRVPSLVGANFNFGAPQ